MNNKRFVSTFSMLLGCLAAFGGQPLAMADSQPLLCAAAEAVVCHKDGACERGPVDRVNLPLFFRIDPGSSVVHSLTEAGRRRTSPITGTTTADGITVYTGTDMTTGWTMVVDRSIGKMTLCLATPGAGYTVFGACLPDMAASKASE
jgi:hypothetical protein